MSNIRPDFRASHPEFVKFDFHMHTLDDPYDQHVYHTVYELIDKAASLGFGALAITLHAQQFHSHSAVAYAEERGILLVPGVEQNIEGVHVLLINFPKEIADTISTFPELAAARKALEKSGAPANLVVAPHPFFPSGVSLLKKFWEHSAHFDAIEVSGFYHRFWNPNQKAMQAAKKTGLPLIGNSDTHTLEQFGKTWSEAQCERNTESLIHAVKSGQVHVRGRSLTFTEMAVIGWKVIAQGYMRWINYKRKRGYRFIP